MHTGKNWGAVKKKLFGSNVQRMDWAGRPPAARSVGHPYLTWRVASQPPGMANASNIPCLQLTLWPARQQNVINSDGSLSVRARAGNATPDRRARMPGSTASRDACRYKGWCSPQFPHRPRPDRHLLAVGQLAGLIIGQAPIERGRRKGGGQAQGFLLGGHRFIGLAVQCLTSGNLPAW